MNPYSLYYEFDRQAWSGLPATAPLRITPEEFEQLKGLNDRVPFQEVEEIYLPLTRFLDLLVENARTLHRTSASFLQNGAEPVPFIIGIAGSVAVGKSTTARLLQLLLSRCSEHRNVELITTDGFLFPNRVLEERGLMKRKGFPESYDIKKLLRFIRDIKAGKPVVHAPVYSHLSYDIVPDEVETIRQPDILIVEGINVLQVGKQSQVFVSDFFDYSIYVDAKEEDIEQWYVERFRMLRETAFLNPKSYFHRFAELQGEELVATASGIWKDINAVNLHENILPTKGRAKMILEKGANHAVQRVFVRK
ncbi:type I pantothenate kinase [Paenibacillus ehimensis]|uniref:Pantothenate kinase n=1 Tax=Paenibacillus ehimensis TaxID=79264 RepID=A0ABT8VLX3_9BACL|nr:type I pantothenate kinase [Paenibacillus ehimensis]MDO3681982.1 type I pantothenate kinase [Paenibacillus ehimensis]MEC0209157.1 type I pantothenate kinase [Paenibacillus ehimensis]